MKTTLNDLVAELHKATKSPYLVAIDGPSGAGKSTLSNALFRELSNVTIVRKDDLYRVMDRTERARLDAEGGYYQNFDWQRLERQVLVPLAANRVARYERYDWVTESLAETITVQPQGIVIVEGVGSSRPELRHFYDLRIWVETDQAERWQRQLDRGENSMELLHRWAASERFYIEGFQPQKWADRVVVGE